MKKRLLVLCVITVVFCGFAIAIEFVPYASDTPYGRCSAVDGDGCIAECPNPKCKTHYESQKGGGVGILTRGKCINCGYDFSSSFPDGPGDSGNPSTDPQ